MSGRKSQINLGSLKSRRTSKPELRTPEVSLRIEGNWSRLDSSEDTETSQEIGTDSTELSTETSQTSESSRGSDTSQTSESRSRKYSRNRKNRTIHRYYNTKHRSERIEHPISQDNTIWYRDLTVTLDPEDYSTPIANDGKTRKSDRGLIISSPVFTTSKPQGTIGALDRVKWLCYHRHLVQVSADETVFEASISGCQIFNPEIPVPSELVSRINNIHEDYRLCCSALVLTDESSMVEAMFLLTNDAIYALYQRLPSERVDLKTSSSSVPDVSDIPASFASSILLMRRGHGPPESKDLLDDYYRLGIGVSNGGTSLVWYIDRREVFRVHRIGYRMSNMYQVLEHGGTPRQVRISSFRAGFGHFTFLDHQLPNNYSRLHTHLDSNSEPGCPIWRSESGLVMLSNAESYREILPDLYGRHHPVIAESSFAISSDSEKFRIFGQGAITCIRSLHIFNCSRGIPSLLSLAPTEEEVPTPQGRVRNSDSLVSIDQSSKSSRVLGGRLIFDESGTPLVRRAYHRGVKTSSKVQLSQESKIKVKPRIEEGDDFNFSRIQQQVQNLEISTHPSQLGLHGLLQQREQTKTKP